MTLNKLASLIAKREGKKSQTAIYNIREVLGILSDLIHEDPINTCAMLIKNGEKRAKRKARVRK